MTTTMATTTSANDEYEILRNKDIEKLKEAGFEVYPHMYNPKIERNLNYLKFDFENDISKFGDLGCEEERVGMTYYIIGRITRIRKASSKLYFADLRIGKYVFQVKINLNNYLDGIDGNEVKYRFDILTSVMRVGDIWGYAGHIGRTKAGELSLYVHHMRMLTPCKKMIYVPKTIEQNGEKKEINGLIDPEIRHRKRWLDMIVNPNVMETLIKRSQIINEITNYLNSLNLINVKTPILSRHAGGANAKPFKTISNDKNCELYMRIAPELYLKELVIGGMWPGVYEIGEQFRNESSDHTHNPEFTSLEYYMVDANYLDLMRQCETMLTNIVEKVNGSLVLNYDGKQINFALPFNRIDMLSELKICGVNLPDEFETNDAQQMLDQECKRLSVECSEPRTTARLLDKLVGKFIESKCVNPTFIVGHPKIMSPLAKSDPYDSQKTERFELFVNGFELCNAYTELNQPDIQRNNFESQSKSKANGDEEAMMPNPEFIEALEIGLPPTAGFGMGIDRLVMLLTNNTTIQEVIAFPLMK